MVAPALLYLAFNPGGPAVRGWPIVLATDLALVLGVLALIGRRCPPQLRMVLLILVMVGDVAAVAVVSLLYAEVVNLLALAVVVELFAVVTVLRLLRVLRTVAYLVVGVALWVATTASGIHPAIVGLLLGVVVTAFRRCRPRCWAVSGSVAGWSRIRPRHCPGKARRASVAQSPRSSAWSRCGDAGDESGRGAAAGWVRRHPPVHRPAVAPARRGEEGRAWLR